MMPKRSISLPSELETDESERRSGQSGSNRATQRLTIDIQLIEGFPLYGNEPARDPTLLRWFACWAGKN
jgi:hypothetical protein